MDSGLTVIHIDQHLWSDERSPTVANLRSSFDTVMNRVRTVALLGINLPEATPSHQLRLLRAASDR